jgi:hypothetical protein
MEAVIPPAPVRDAPASTARQRRAQPLHGTEPQWRYLILNRGFRQPGGLVPCVRRVWLVRVAVQAVKSMWWRTSQR